MSHVITVHCPSCGAAEQVQVYVSSFRQARAGQSGYEVDFHPSHVDHVCPNALADWTPDNSRDGVSLERPNVRPMRG